ncbi:MAG: putative damage-inducible protein DinB [Parvicella sp.]|jgi:uncharacterized damage-inducible protein DinB
MKPSDLTTAETGTYFSRYTSLVPELSIVEGLNHSSKVLLETLESLPSFKWNYAYAEGKWTIKELLLHLIDTERIFVNRALRFARKDTTPLPGYEENDYAATCLANNRSADSLIKEYKAVRASTESFFGNLNEEQLLSIGTSGGNQISVRAIGYLLAGHDLHHLTVIKERYL